MNSEDYASWVNGAAPARRRAAETISNRETAFDITERIYGPTAVSSFEESVHIVMSEAAELLLRKHNDYGPANVGRSPGGPMNGLRVRAWDKIARINNLVDSGAEPENESLRDSWVDLLNYAAIALLVLDGKWPE